jgi:hypothetical protein
MCGFYLGKKLAYTKLNARHLWRITNLLTFFGRIIAVLCQICNQPAGPRVNFGSAGEKALQGRSTFSAILHQCANRAVLTRVNCCKLILLCCVYHLF